MSASGSWIGVDWGGTRIKWGAIDDHGAVTHSEIVPLDRLGTAQSVLDELMASIAAGFEGPISAMGLSLTSVVDPHRGVVMLPGKVAGLEGFPVVDRLKDRFGCQVIADNDGRAAMRAERRFGAARDVTWCVTLTIGTGIGSGVMIDGRIPINPHLQFGTQMGHLSMQGPSDQRCLTGGEGTGEMACSATALVIDVAASIQRGLETCLSGLYHTDPRALTFERIIEDGVRTGDPLCVSLFDRWIVRLSRLVTNAIHAYGPQKVILSGGAVRAADLFVDRLRTEIGRRSYVYPPDEAIPVVVSDMPDLAGVVGAAVLAMETMP